MTTVSEEVLDRRADRLVEAKNALLEQLVAMRQHHKLSQQEVADRMGVSQPTVAAFERYDANPTLSSIIRYAMAVEAVLDMKVIDDCGKGVPSDWQFSGSAQHTVKVPSSRPPQYVLSKAWDVTQEDIYA
nr:helix-turn-helix transcriptional regulator [Actinomyces sp.]